MTQYIDKAALLEYLNKLYEKHATQQSIDEGGVVINEIEYFIDTLEVKEVDLKEEIDKIWKPRFNSGWDDKSMLSVTYEGFGIIAKHFFELGLKTQKGE